MSSILHPSPQQEQQALQAQASVNTVHLMFVGHMGELWLMISDSVTGLVLHKVSE